VCNFETAVKVVNDPHVDPKYMVYMMKCANVHGRSSGTVVPKQAEGMELLVANGEENQVFHRKHLVVHGCSFFHTVVCNFEIAVKVVNDPHLDHKYTVYMMKCANVHGRFSGTVVPRQAEEMELLVVNGDEYQVFHGKHLAELGRQFFHTVECIPDTTVKVVNDHLVDLMYMMYMMKCANVHEVNGEEYHVFYEKHLVMSVRFVEISLLLFLLWSNTAVAVVAISEATRLVR
jgi:glyceraldehyde-3-phosphate dehydrogenase/erythrose-4-phosphate dehydrogenase